MNWRWSSVVGLVVAVLAAAETAVLEWTASPSPGVAGYRVHYGTSSGVYPFAVSVGPVTSNEVALPWRGPWFFAVTARDTNGYESRFSNEAPVLNGEWWVGLRPVIERSTNLAAWSSVTGAATWLPATNALEFFRTRELRIESVNKVEAEP